MTVRRVIGKPSLNGKATRKLSSWIDTFVETTENLEAPELFRKWAAIVAIGAVLEQKVWLTTSSPIYPNLYVFLIGHPGTGKTRTIRQAKNYLKEIAEFHVAPISLSWASLVDALVRSKRTIIQMGRDALEYNTMLVAPDEIGAFMHKWDNEMTDGLSVLYDPDPYERDRRINDTKVRIQSPQINLLSGATPARLHELMPDSAWGQGFSSRVIMVFSDERIVGDDFAEVTRELNKDLVHDLTHLNAISGEFTVTEDYRNLVKLWRDEGEQPAPNHPKLVHYNSRRRVHLYKLSMVAALDRADALILTREDFNKAMNWLVEAEGFMPDVFKAGNIGADAQAMDEIYHFCLIGDLGKGIPEHRLTKFVAERVPIHSVMRVLEIMERAHRIEIIGRDKRTGAAVYRAIPAQADDR